MHSVLAESFNLLQVKDLGTPINTIHFYKPATQILLIHGWGVYAILLLCWAKLRFNTLVRYTLPQNFADVQPVF